MQDSYIATSRYFKLHQFDFHDGISILFIGILVLFVGQLIKKKHSDEKYYQKYFLPGLIAKTMGGLTYALVYTYYYNYGGDTSGFWWNGMRLFMILIEYPEYYVDAFTRNFNTQHSFVLNFLKTMLFAKDWEEYRMVQITSIIAPFGLLNFFGSSMLLAALCYTGVWRLFLTFREYYPLAEKQLAIAVLFIPSVVFWGSGIMKDTVVFASVGLLIYAVNSIFFKRQFKISEFLILILSVYLIASMKAYVLFSLAPGLVVWRILRYRKRIRSPMLQRLALPLFFTLSILGGFGVVKLVGKYNSHYSLENFIAGAKSMQGWHYQEGANTSEQYGRGSSYTLGDYDPSLNGLLKVAPAAINVTFFRPYPWETTTFMQLFTASESFVVLLLTLSLLFSNNPFKLIRIINNDAFLIMMLSFSILFAFGVGFSAYNFGALVRYKVPCMPFFVGAILVLRFKLKNRTKKTFN